ncbi:transposase [Escherichia coli]|uniref:transposase n=1 Tax=Escherichia coli TaxID=562 RepID=UPI00336BD6C4
MTPAFSKCWNVLTIWRRSIPKLTAPVSAILAVSISKLALENGINANLLFKWRQQWREGKLLLPSSESPQLLPVTLDAAAEQPESLAEDPETLSISCEVTFRHGTLRFNGNVSEKLLTLLIQELKR